MEVVRSSLILGIALCGLAIVILSFMTWVNFETRAASLPTRDPITAGTSGTETSIWRDNESINERVQAPAGVGWCTCDVSFGDGYITAALGLLLVLSTAVAAFTVFGGWALVISTIASLGTLVVAGFNAFADWSALISISDAGTTVPADGEVEAALYGIVVVAALATVLSATARVVDSAYDNDEEYDYEDEFDDEGSAAGGDSWVSA